MSQPVSWQVRASPDVEQVIRQVARGRASARLVADYRAGLDQLARSGTRANGVKMLRSLELWEVRMGEYRAFFCPVPGTGVIAIGALVAKRTGKLRMKRLRTIERRVHRWRDELEAET